MPCGRQRAECLVNEEDTALARMRHAIARESGQMSVTRSAARASRHTCFINAAAFYAMLVTDTPRGADRLDAQLRVDSSLLRRNLMLDQDFEADGLLHRSGCSLCALCLETSGLIHAVHWFAVVSDADVAYVVQSAAWVEDLPGGGTKCVCAPLSGTEHCLKTYHKHAAQIQCGSPTKRRTAFRRLFGPVPADLDDALAAPGTAMAVYTVANTKGA
jgi:hypothetical protein